MMTGKIHGCILLNILAFMAVFVLGIFMLVQFPTGSEPSLAVSQQRQDITLEEYDKNLIRKIQVPIIVCIILSFIFMVYQIWLAAKSIHVSLQEDEADMRMRLMLDATPLNCTLWDTEGNLLDCDGDTLRVYGLSRKSDYLEHFYDFNPEYQPNGESSRDAVMQLTRKVMETGYERANWMSHTPEGEELPFESTLVRVPWKNGYRIAVYSRDLRENKAKETVIQETENRLQAMLDNLSISCFFLSPDGKLLDCNEQSLKTFGFDSKEELMEDFYRLSPEYQSDGNSSRQMADKYFMGTFETGQKVISYWDHIKKDGTPLPMNVTLVRIKWNGGYRLIAYHQDLTELTKTEEKLRRVLAVAESSPNFNMFLGNDGNPKYLNPAVLKNTGYSAEELIEGGLSLLFSTEDFERFNDDYLAYALKDNMINFEMPVVDKDGVKRDYLFSAFPAHLNKGITGVGVLGRDITEFNRMQRDLAIAKEQAERALESEVQYNQAKSDFLSRVSHELRTPLNAIIGVTNIADKTRDEPERVKNNAKIKEASEHLLNLVNDILDLNSIDTDSFDFLPQPFSMSAALCQVADNISKKTKAKNQSFTLVMDSGIHDDLYSDERRLKQALQNLLLNAIKFTPENGKIELSVKLLEKDANQYSLLFEVKDNGIGMSPDVLENLGGIFEQADNSITREYGGMGLGLCLTKRIIDRMNGQIWVDSEFGKGSCFSIEVCFPIAFTGCDKTKAPLEQESAEAPDFLDLKGKRILLVDDVVINREIIIAMLEETGAAINEASTGEEAVKMFSRDKYDLVLMDLHMPVMDGFTASKTIRDLEQPWAQLIPIISVSAENSCDLKAKCAEAGINDHIAKPVDMDVLFSTISRWVPCAAA